MSSGNLTCQMEIGLFTKVAKLNPQFEKCWCSNRILCGKWVERMHWKKGDEAMLLNYLHTSRGGGSFTGRVDVLWIPLAVHQDRW